VEKGHTIEIGDETRGIIVKLKVVCCGKQFGSAPDTLLRGESPPHYLSALLYYLVSGEKHIKIVDDLLSPKNDDHISKTNRFADRMCNRKCTVFGE